MCNGEKNPMLIVSTTMIELLYKEELEAALAHELGHLACGHSFTKS
ncbi:MAG: M48 family metalloprotease [Lentisphaerales bacterium]|nr:M48 family metalloprotease [Lentisphaerales bacterium]